MYKAKKEKNQIKKRIMFLKKIEIVFAILLRIKKKLFEIKFFLFFVDRKNQTKKNYKIKICTK